ncbi:MAG: hypothetical protein N2441_10630 [Rhodocyclaceae bacterium]|nr:hypothetical protein [Rhodocyclaceae bacterium]
MTRVAPFGFLYRTMLIVIAYLAWPARAELIVVDTSAPPAEIYYAHPTVRSLVFVSPEMRAQAILPPSPVFVAPPPLIWRAPGTTPLSPPGAILLGVNRAWVPGNRDLAAWNIARAHAFSQDLYRRQDGAAATTLAGGSPAVGWLWVGSAPTALWLASPYPPPAPQASHPSNRDNATYLIERAHRFSQDAYRRP